MKPPPFDYHCPRTLDEALTLLSRTGNAKVLAGGQSLMAMLNLRYLYPDALIDINCIPDLDRVRVEGHTLRIGAMTRQRHLETHPLLAGIAPIMVEALKLVGHRQTRNRGTLGGSLCHLDPAAELPTVCLLYDAVIHVASSRGRRSVPIRDFITGYMSPGIDADELVIEIELPIWPSGHGRSFLEYARRHGDFAIASAACLIERDDRNNICRAAIAIGGVGSVAQRLVTAEAELVGNTGDEQCIVRAVSHCDQLEILSDFHATSDYRRSVVGAVLRRSLLRACQSTGETAPV